MNNIKIILFLCGIILLTAFSCEEENGKENSLFGKWKLEGFGSINNTEMCEAEPKDCEPCYTLIFKKNGTLEGMTSTNEVWGDFSLSSSNKITITNLGGTEINELFDGPEFCEAFLNAERYTIIEKRLKLFYNQSKLFLSFKSIEQ